MRIIAGKYKGHKLVSFDEAHIRPMTDRVKESLFNIIAGYIEGARVLDLYSGTGSVGLEALSRGAKSIDFVENHSKSITLIRKNIEILKVAPQVEIHKTEAIKYLRNYKGEGYDLIFIDPPFPAQICLATLEAVSPSSACKESTKIIIEHSRHEPLPEKVATLSIVDTRPYGDKILSFYDPTN